jgi:H+/gluconate symporter-like permease
LSTVSIILGGIMKKLEVTLPDLALIVGTRAMFGAGLALLLADKLQKDQRKAIGWTLTLVGVVTTIPLAINFLLRSDWTDLSNGE